MSNKSKLISFNIPTIFSIIFILLGSTQLVLANGLSNKLTDYLNKIKSVAVEFKQIDSSNNKAEGMLLIDKPYKFRCNYYEPFPLLILGNKNYVSVYDYEMEHLSRIKAEENIFYFLLVNKIDFNNKFKIIHEEEINGHYTIILTHLDSSKESKIIFNSNTKQIELMQIFEDNNIITINFGKTYQINNINQSLFIIQDPDIYGKPNRLNKTLLQKEYQIIK